MFPLSFLPSKSRVRGTVFQIYDYSDLDSDVVGGTESGAFTIRVHTLLYGCVQRIRISPC